METSAGQPIESVPPLRGRLSAGRARRGDPLRGGGIASRGAPPDGRRRRAAAGLAALVAALGPASGGAAWAQTVLFQPELFVGASYTDNALVLGTEENETLIYRAGAILPLTRNYPRGRFRLSYSPVYERFEDFEELDHLSHRATLGWTARPSERSNFGFNARWARFQDDRSAEGSRRLLFLREPLERETAAVDLSVGRRIGRRWRWSGGAGYSTWSFEPVDETSTATFEDRDETRGSLGLARILKPGFTVGAQYGIRRFDLEVTGEATAHTLSLTVDRTVQDRFKLAFGIGGFVTEGDTESSEGEGVQGWLTVSRTFREHTLSLTGTHRPSVGGSRLGTAEVSSATLGLDGTVAESWHWGLYGRYGRRDPDLEQEVRIDSVGADAYLERRFREVVGILLGLGYAEQTADDLAQEGDVFRGNLSLVLYPLGRTELGGYEP